MNRADVLAAGARLLSAAPAFLIGISTTTSQMVAQDMNNGADNFYKGNKVTVEKVTFKNQYRMTIAGNLFVPKGSTGWTSSRSISSRPSSPTT